MSKARLVLVMAVATVLVFSVVAALVTAEKEKEQSKPKVTLELIWQKEFEAPVAAYLFDLDERAAPVLRIVAFVYGHGVGPSATYGKRVVVNFLDSEGKKTRVVDRESDFFGSYVMISRNGRYIGLRRVTERGGELIAKVDFELYDADGNLVWARKNLDARPSRVLSNSRMLSYEGMFWQRFSLHVKNGIVTELNPTSAEGTGAMDISENNYMVFNVHDLAERVGHIVFYDPGGNEMWRRDFNWRDTGEVTLSDRAEYIAAIGKSKGGRMLHVFSGAGDLLWQYASGDCQFMDFSPDSRYLAAGLNLSEIYLFQSDSGTVLWNYKFDSGRLLYSLGVSKDAELVAAADGAAGREGPLGDSSNVLLFNKQGSVLWQKQFEIQAQRAPDLLFTDDGRHLLVASGNRISCYNIPGGVK